MPRHASHLDPSFERSLRSVMYDRELPCPHCRYNLSGLPSTRCPECGQEVGDYLRVADLSPERIRRERFQRTLLVLGRVLGTLAWIVIAGAAIALFLQR